MCFDLNILIKEAIITCIYTHYHYLHENHIWHRNKLHDGNVEHRAPPVVMNVHKILEQVDL